MPTFEVSSDTADHDGRFTRAFEADNAAPGSPPADASFSVSPKALARGASSVVRRNGGSAVVAFLRHDAASASMPQIKALSEFGRGLIRARAAKSRQRSTVRLRGVPLKGK